MSRSRKSGQCGPVKDDHLLYLWGFKEGTQKSLSNTNSQLSLLEMGGNIIIEKKEPGVLSYRKYKNFKNKIAHFTKKSVIHIWREKYKNGFRKIGRFLKCHKAEEKIKNS